VAMVVVQSTSSYEDLGVATSGVSFLRTLGSSFGVAVFGTVYASNLPGNIAAALPPGLDPATAATVRAAASNVQALHALPAEVKAPIIAAYADTLHLVFLSAAPVAAVAFLVALFLKEVPLREMEAVTVDLGEGFAMPSTEQPEKMLEIAVGRMFRHEPDIRLRNLAGTRGCELDVARLWAAVQIYRHNQVHGWASVSSIADGRRIPAEVLEPAFDRLVETGYALRTGDRLWLTQAGARQVDVAIGALVGKLVQRLAEAPDYQGRPDKAQVEAALERIAHRMVLQPQWVEDRAELTATAGTKN
jgi:hypothetical protein